MARDYYLPVSDFCVESCFYCESIGCKSKHNKKKEAIDLSLQKAKSGEYERVILPCNTVFLNNEKEVLQQVFDSGLTLVLQLNVKTLNDSWGDNFKSLLGKNIYLQIIFDQVNEETLSSVELVKNSGIDYELVMIAHKRHEFLSEFKKIPELLKEKLYVNFPLPLESKGFYYDNLDICEILTAAKEANLSIKTHPSMDIYDARIGEDLDLEPIHPAKYTSRVNDEEKLKYSVVIPMYNCGSYIKATVRHLFEQDLPAKDYEIIVVDDGSDDDAGEQLVSWVKEVTDQRNFQYIYFPRKKSREMGDGQFRAGIARNLGVKNARGEHVLFLDADIIVAKDLLSSLIEGHKKWDLIQAKRLFLKKESSHLDTEIGDLNVEKDTFLPEGDYWQSFYDDKRSWQDLPHFWKYVCTYCLSMKTQDFKNLGWFKKSFHYYGFEDTDLGYRFADAKKSFHLLDAKVFHLFHSDQRSEYKNSDFHRFLILKKTAQIFFLSHLDLEIASALGELVKPSFSLRKVKKAVKKVFNLFKFKEQEASQF